MKHRDVKHRSVTYLMRWTSSRWVGLLAILLVCGTIAQAEPKETQQNSATQRRETILATVEGFVSHLETSSFDADARTWVVKKWSERREEKIVGPFLCEALAVLSPEFKKALDAYEAEEYARAAALMQKLTEAKDPYLSANARAFEIKAMVESDLVEDAVDKITALLPAFAEMKKHTVHVPELHFLLGFCRLQTLQYDRSRQTLLDFLVAHPEAPRRLRETAMHMVQDLTRRKPGQIGDVADLTGYAGRRINTGRVDDDTKARQVQAVALLDDLIKQAEEQENAGQGKCKSCNGKGCKKCNGGNKAGGKNASGAKRSQVSGGPTRVGALRTVVARPGEQWGEMRPEQRDRILQTIDGKFPARYRELVKQYYETLAKQP